MPDQVRVQRRRAARRARRRARCRKRRPIASTRTRRRGRDRDLREPDDEPVAAEDPVERDQEAAVERLGVRRRDAREEAERPARDERLREVVALLGVRREDRAALVEQHREPRQDRGGRRRPESRSCRCEDAHVTGLERYAVVSCHVERPLDDAVWAAFERLLERRPGGLRRHAAAAAARRRRRGRGASGSSARAARPQLAPLGHHTHWGGPTQARPAGRRRCGRGRARARPSGSARAASSRATSAAAAGTSTSRSPRRSPRSATSTARRRRSGSRTSPTDAPRLQLAAPRRLRLPSGASLLELPATHSLGMLGRGLLRLRRPRAPALPRLGARRPPARARARRGFCGLLRLRRRPLTIASSPSAPQARRSSTGTGLRSPRERVDLQRRRGRPRGPPVPPLARRR